MGTKNKKYAVLFIHGIGEQKPMETLRPFVEAIRNCLKEIDKSEDKSVIRNKSDKSSTILETRVLRLSKTRNRPVIDFYEYYWAHYMRNNTFSDVFDWIFKLMFSKYKNIPKSLKSTWWTFWITLIFIACIILLVVYIPVFAVLYKAIASIVIVSFLAKIIIDASKKKLADYIGDAGRYFTPSPDNIESRYKIRRKGIELLEYLQQNYDRVIVVGHSLGGVIGYDLLRFLWSDYHLFDNEIKPENLKQPILKRMKKYDNESISQDNIIEFQQMQFQCLQEQISIGMKWKITDFITLGSPLCNIDYYLSAGKTPFSVLVEEREYPVCPPVNDEEDNDISYVRNIKKNDHELTYRCLHRAAAFAVTRWTNIYYKNDIIGGKMSRLFGNGVKNIEINEEFNFFNLGGHKKYWDEKHKTLEDICNALHLKDIETIK